MAFNWLSRNADKGVYSCRQKETFILLFLNKYLFGALSCRFFATVLAVAASWNTSANEKRKFDYFDLKFNSFKINVLFGLIKSWHANCIILVVSAHPPSYDSLAS